MPWHHCAPSEQHAKPKKTTNKMKYLYDIIFMMLMSWLLMITNSSCSTAKRHSSAIFASDSSTKQISNYHAESHSIQLKDTAIKVLYKNIFATFKPAQLQPLYTAQGKPTERIYRIDTNGLRATITALIDGSISVQCEADSYKILVQNLIRENHFLRSSKDSTNVLRSTFNKTDITTKIKTFALANIIPLVLMAIVLFFGLISLIKK